jgi:hypothetical protein
MALDDQLVDIRGIERVEDLQSEVIQDQQVDPDQLAALDVVAVVEP